jgi:hypothetical protein
MAELDRLIDSLLYEGYALYPYTPGATKNATPTPFGIVYPPRYAETLTSTHDHLDLRCVLAADGDAEVMAEVRFLASAGAGHRAAPVRIELPAARVAALRERRCEVERTVDGDRGEPLRVRLVLSAAPAGAGAHEISLRVGNLTDCEPGVGRGAALRRSLLSTHPLLRTSRGRFISPLDRPCAALNTYPVLATDSDDAVLGAAFVLPDHPRIAPESRGGLFDSTEIEEALVLHVQALSDAERAEIAAADPAVREMVERAAAATPGEIAALHGRVTLRDPAARDPVTLAPPEEPPGLADPSAGEDSAEVDGVAYRRGGHVRLRPGPDADLHARLLDGREATIERIFVDYDGRVHLGVTVDGDPGQELMRETNRLLFFFVPEVEVIDRERSA